MVPTQAWETSVVPIGGDPFRPRLDGQSGVIGVANQIPLCLSDLA